MAFHLDGDGAGGDIVTIDADAEILDTVPTGLADVYLAKYEPVIRERLGSTPETMVAGYSTTVRLIPRRVRSW